MGSMPSKGSSIQATKKKPASRTREGLMSFFEGDKMKRYGRFVLAVLSSIHWVGGVLSALAALSSEKDQGKVDDLQRLWLDEQKKKIELLGKTLDDIFSRLDGFGDEVKDRIESEEYLSLVRKCFRSWDKADTEEKRLMLQKLISNAGAKTLCPDDLIRLFIDWIDRYHEAHFIVIKEIYKSPGITRREIWQNIHGEIPRDNSAEADLFRYLIHELSTGHVIRQTRATDLQGRFLKKSTRGMGRSPSSNVMTSAFEDTKQYVLTELGSKFVHYVMDDLVPQLEE